MNATLLLKSLAAWAVILVLAIANGALREGVLIPAFGKSAGFVLSGALLSGLIVVLAYWLARLSPGLPVSRGFRIGGLWLALTLSFEFGFGRFVQHKSWAELGRAYTFEDGNLWPLVLVVVLLAPPLMAKRQAKSRFRMVAPPFSIEKTLPGKRRSAPPTKP